MNQHFFVFFITICLAMGYTMPAEANDASNDWYQYETGGDVKVILHFFWSKKCPHCLTAQPYIELMQEENDWLIVKSYQLVGEEQNIKRFQLMAHQLGKNAQSVPAFLLCNSMTTGFDATSTPDQLMLALQDCQEYLNTHSSLADYQSPLSPVAGESIGVDLPFFGKLESEMESLPFLTLALAGVDAFNPCAFFVLMFLLSMMLHTGSRKRMLLVGGIFVFFSGLLYFIFMSAWLNLFRLIGQLEIITIVAALIAMVIGAINIKDFFWFKKGVSLSIAEENKPALYQRVRNMLRAQSLTTLLMATVGLSFFANMYEFLCTAGFPMVYTRILTLSELSTSQYYLYLTLYNIIYVVPLAVIVLLFSISMGGKKMQQDEGRGLKLISGTMMLALGVVLFVDPNLLHNIMYTISIMVFAITIALLIIFVDKMRRN